MLNYQPRRKTNKEQNKTKIVVLVIKDGFSVYEPLKCLNSQTVHSVSPIFPCYFFRAISEFERPLSESPQYVERKLGILGRPADGDGR